jgi:hypothetical protein
MRRVHEFVDRGLSRSRADWEGFKIPAPLRELADEVWELISQLTEPEPIDVGGRLEAARAAYIALYEEAEAIAQSSIHASRRRPPAPGPAPTPAVKLVRRVPKRYRRMIPLRWRSLAVRALDPSRWSRR